MKRSQLSLLRQLRDGTVFDAICPPRAVSMDDIRTLDRGGYIDLEKRNGVYVALLTYSGRAALRRRRAKKRPTRPKKRACDACGFVTTRIFGWGGNLSRPRWLAFCSYACEIRALQRPLS